MPALETERAHLAASRQALKRMRAHAEDLFSTGDQVAGDPFAAETLGRRSAYLGFRDADNACEAPEAFASKPGDLELLDLGGPQDLLLHPDATSK